MCLAKCFDAISCFLSSKADVTGKRRLSDLADYDNRLFVCLLELTFHMAYFSAYNLQHS